jgi:hypothetical protein
MIVKGRVVRIFDDEKVAVNLGRKDGVVSGKRVWFFAPPTDIEDPETEEILGTYRHLKATGKVASVAEKFSVVVPYAREEETVPAGAQLGIFGSMRTPTVKRRVPGHLPVNDLQADPVPGGDGIGVGDEVELEIED